VSVGFAVTIVLAMAWRRRSSALGASSRTFALFGASFAVLSLGPRLQVLGHSFGWMLLPYQVLEWAFRVHCTITDVGREAG